jgi:hypothetical protein
VLFSADLLEDIDFEAECHATFNPQISPSNPGESLIMRPLHISDYDKGKFQFTHKIISTVMTLDDWLL